ncbi:hypothetical protein EJB05_16823, partial [Eragrostis curvula]
MAHSSWLTACSPWSAFATLAALTTGLLVLSYVSSAFLGRPGYEYDDPYSPDVSSSASLVPRRGAGSPPVFAYYITGGREDSVRVTRLLKAVYHRGTGTCCTWTRGPAAYERARLAGYVRSEQAFLEYGNVHVVGKGDPVDVRGASSVAALLWCSRLCCADLLHAFSYVPKDLNFIEHKPDSETHHVVVLDQNLLQNTNAEISFSSGHREKPDAFELFKGSRWTILSRSFVEHCVAAPDNLGRTLLMYFSNTLDPADFYFQTIAANSARFKNSTVNHSVRFVVPPPGVDPRFWYDAMVNGGAAFAGDFGDDDALLQRIDEEVLRRPLDGVTPGEWCKGPDGEEGECSVGGDINAVRQGAAGRRLASLVAGLVGTAPCEGCNSVGAPVSPSSP